MSKTPARSIRVYLDHVAAYSSLNSSAQNISQATPSVECFGDNGPKVIVDKYDYDHDDMGFFEPEAADPEGGFTGIDEEVWTRMFLESAVDDEDVDRYLGKCFAGITEGNVAYESVVRLASVPRSAQIGGAVMMGFKSVGAGRLFRGLVLRSGTLTGGGNGTGQNVGGNAEGDTLRVIFRLISFTGTSITLKVQHAPTVGGSYVDVAGLTSGALTERGIVVAETTLAVDDFLRVVTSGTFTSAAILVTAGVLT